MVSTTCSITEMGFSGVGSSGPSKQRVTGGRMVVAEGSPPLASQAPVQSSAVSGPQPGISGRNPDPEPGYCGPVVVVGPPLPLPLPLPLPHLPAVHLPLTHSSAEAQALPSDRSCPAAQVPLAQTPLAQSLYA